MQFVIAIGNAADIIENFLTDVAALRPTQTNSQLGHA